ncbi:hypothetical protein A3B48_00870 [Candidatus Gottesmanbacteria bacterium RIFCSPLOWO2_01_FULL_40_10]|uniref:Uncharacterized protein n=1 Tax=Candidatus Gottesmanbacteria bacterium RIFCSPHIGHO2_01_FULL_40_15 TaxID=1798376 RepID=A0A1F5Z7D6_9BACT|nr:MAG: hypothetical protein A2777_04620 [Candidatus Gottesmanbacteria bacterium RIFCSPHIGHO2_01_FULL_40_15]OGG20630.1 MAG: hypothetical protein A3B48_00870 [Candidatus Gottesmanbacteria bacterium RIFCSPLOWO2_01_FULL_40_10]OGG25438.1 MAG: hypothetical protein A3E42_05440 [Candidatus Gottesmanbacteria bacterium RIFCSPHIGHO2_12_FULL_40_13]
MDKNKLLLSLLIVSLFIILILSYTVLFKGNNKTPNKQGEIETITPPIESDYDEPFIKEFNEAQLREYQYTLSTGEEITIQVPANVDPPPQEVVERMYLRQQEK